MYSPVVEQTDWNALLVSKRQLIRDEVYKLLSNVDENGFYSPGYLKYCGWCKYVQNDGRLTIKDECGSLAPFIIDDLPIESLINLLEHLRTKYGHL